MKSTSSTSSLEKHLVRELLVFAQEIWSGTTTRSTLWQPCWIVLLHSLWLELSNELGAEEVQHHDVVQFALNQLKDELREGKREEVIGKFRALIQKRKVQRGSNPE
jgi:hypothetical protein